MYPFFPVNYGEGTQNRDDQPIDTSRRGLFWRPLPCPALDESPALPRIVALAVLTAPSLILPSVPTVKDGGAVWVAQKLRFGGTETSTGREDRFDRMFEPLRMEFGAAPGGGHNLLSPTVAKPLNSWRTA